MRIGVLAILLFAVVFTRGGESVSCHISGPIKLAYAEMLPNSEVTAVSLEFGTFSGKEVFAAMRAENWLYHYGGNDNAGAIKIKDEMVRMFYPDSDDWKSRAWFQGKEVIKQALIGLK